MVKTIVVFLVLGALTGEDTVVGQGRKPALGALSWISGCWRGGTDSMLYEEQWMTPSGGTMLGVSRTLAKGRTVEYEFIRLHEEEDGSVFYTAHPSGQEEASFKLIKSESGLAVFENPGHDFPQRIIYHLEGDGSLHARIEGRSEGEEKGLDFPMKRAKCD